MSQARQREQWNHTAAVMAMLANIHRDPKRSRPFKPADFHPMPAESGGATERPVLKGDVSMLKSVFVDRR